MHTRSLHLKCFLLAVAVALVPSLGFAGINDKIYGSILVERVTSIIDGDSFRVDVSEWPPVVGESIPIRVRGVDSPELRAKCSSEKALARKARQHTVAKLRDAKEIELRNIKRGKYFRLLAEVYVDGESLGSSLVQAGLAVAYSGGTRASWCDP